MESWVDRTEGRKVFTVGTISAGGEVTARAEGVFIRVEGGAAARQLNESGEDPRWRITGSPGACCPRRDVRRVLVFSPHFDDAAMGAGHLLLAHPGATVVTVFAGPPARYPDEPTEWDALGGFRAGDDVVADPAHRGRCRAGGARRRAPLARVRRPPVPDARGNGRRRRQMVPAMTRGDRRGAADRGRGCRWASPTPTTWRPTTPALLVAATRPDLTWFGYEDAGYKHIPGMLAWRVSKLFQSDFWPTPMIVPTVQDHAAQARRRSSATARSSRRSTRTTRSPHASTGTCPSSSGCSRIRPPDGSGCASCDRYLLLRSSLKV